MTDTSPRSLIRRLADDLEGITEELVIPEYAHTEKERTDASLALVAEARAYLALPEPEAPTEEEILELSGEHFDYRGDSMGGWFIPLSIGPTIDLSNQVQAFARAVLARWGK